LAFGLTGIIDRTTAGLSRIRVQRHRGERVHGQVMKSKNTCRTTLAAPAGSQAPDHKGAERQARAIGAENYVRVRVLCGQDATGEPC
jgi:hypothetical protein